MKNGTRRARITTNLDPYSLDDLLKAHGTMMAGLVRHPGCLRNDDVGVYAGDVLIHPGSPARLVPQLMSDLFTWLHDSEDHPLVKGSVFHYEFEFIHPFMDGNGRTGRLWHSLILRRWRPIFAWLPVETLVHQHQQEYYDALLEASNQGDSTVFVEFMLKAIRDALSDVKAQQTSDGRAMDERLTSGGQALVDSRRELVLAAAQERTLIRAAEVAELLGVSRQRARAIIGAMVSEGLLEKHGNGRYTYYTPYSPRPRIGE